MNMRKMSKILPALRWMGVIGLAMLLTAGCTSIKRSLGPQMEIKNLDYKEGETHYGDVLQELGPPPKLTALGDGFAFLYEEILTDEPQLSFGLGWIPIPVIRSIEITLSRAECTVETLLLIFDREGILRSQLARWPTKYLGSGGGVELFISVNSYVDTETLQVPTGPNQWGTSLLGPLPQVLNLPHDLYTGVSGVELRGTSYNVGQETLAAQQPTERRKKSR